jgi:UDP-4-amino-4,6-dideoxy-N-acetyl-beta-L-altrosamine N-acetyltransferase
MEWGSMIKFVRLQEEHLEKVMAWRVSPEVTQYMISDIEYNMDKQYEWFNRVIKDDTCRYWVIFYQNTSIGLINLADINNAHRHCSAGYYIGEQDYRQIGAMVPPYLYNYIFKTMKFRKIYGEVLAGNKNILYIHKMHGFREVGIYRDHIFKGGLFYDVVLIELLAEPWLSQAKYQRYVTEFP